MEEKKDLLGGAVPEENSDFFAGDSAEDAVSSAEAAEPALGEEAAEPASGVEESFAGSEAEEALLEAERKTHEEVIAYAEEEAAQKAHEEFLKKQEEERRAQEEAERIAREEALKAQEEARKAQEEAERKAREEALRAQEAERKAQEAERRAQETERRAQEKAQKDAEKREKKEARRAAIEARKQAIKDWVPGPQFPNRLTIFRICMIPLVVIFILWVPKPAGNIISMILFIIAALTDTADGYIARKYNYVSTFGKFMDPLADKLLVCSTLICLVDLGRIESWIVIIIIAREFIISGFRLVAVEKGVVIAANIWGKVKTVVQMVMVVLMLGNFGGFLGGVAQLLKWAALVLTLISLVTYLLENRNVLQDEVKEVV